MGIEDAGVDHRQRVEERDVSARRRLQRLGRGVDLGERARRGLDGADDGLDMRMAFGGGKDVGGTLGQHLLQSRICRGGDDGIEIGA